MSDSATEPHTVSGNEAYCKECGWTHEAAIFTESKARLYALRNECGGCGADALHARSYERIAPRPTEPKLSAVREVLSTKDLPQVWQAFDNISCHEGTLGHVLRALYVGTPLRGNRHRAFHKMPESHRTAILSRLRDTGAVEGDELTTLGVRLLKQHAGRCRCGRYRLAKEANKPLGGRRCSRSVSVAVYACPECDQATRDRTRTEAD